MYNKTDLIQGMTDSAAAINNWLGQQEAEKFAQGPEGKWHTSQHLDHLKQTFKLLNTAIRTPKFLLRFRFGTPNRPSRNYEAVKQRYQEKLKTLDGFNNPFAGKQYAPEEKTKLMTTFSKEVARLQKGISKWKESDLDKYLLPHPLLGKMTIREIMQWAIYHNYHHLDNLKQNY